MRSPGLSEPVQECALRDERGFSMEHRPYFVRSSRGIERLATIEDRLLSRSGIDWEIVDEAIQEKLSRLTERVMQLLPNLVWRAGSHSARHISLSSYRIFDRLDGDDFDPVYAGITIVEVNGMMRIAGDISGEETGRIYFDRGCELLVSPDNGSVIAAAIEVVSRISEQEKIVIEAIGKPRSSLT
jgi:hypothetical protein